MLSKPKTFKSLPSVALRNRSKLPEEPGIYIVTSCDKVIYVGQAEDINERWNATGNRKHHKLEIISDKEQYTGVRIYYQICSTYKLNEVETYYYNLYDPPLNKIRPPSTRKKKPLLPFGGAKKKKRSTKTKRKVVHKKQKSVSDQVFQIVSIIFGIMFVVWLVG